MSKKDFFSYWISWILDYSQDNHVRVKWVRKNKASETQRIPPESKGGRDTWNPRDGELKRGTKRVTTGAEREKS